MGVIGLYRGAVWLAEYINWIREIAFSFVSFFFCFLSFYFALYPFCVREFGLLYSTLLCRFPLCGAGFCLLARRKYMDGWNFVSDTFVGVRDE